MEQTKLSTRLVISAFALAAASSCAANTSDDSAAAGAGNASSSAGATASGGTSSGGAPSGGAPSGSSGTVGVSGTSAGGATSPAGGTSSAGGGSSAGACAATVAPADLISDFETGKAEVAMQDGRGGSWFIFNDGTGTQTPVKVADTPLAAEAGGACGSMFAFHSTATGFTVFGAGFGADFMPKPKGTTASVVYNAGVYSGIALRAKAANPVVLRVSVSDVGTAPEGMKCVDTTDATNPMRCGDYFGSDITLSTDWQDFVLPFAAMKQRGFGLPIATGIDKTQVYTFRAQVKGSAAAPCVFDLWVDDIRFVK
jgi:hypothetical protein